MKAIDRLLRDEHGQDLTEYSLVVATIALASAALFLGVGGNVNTIWQSGAATVSNAASAAGPATSDDGRGDHRRGPDGGGDN
jgi:Flp pilus assembly pilin Flp